MAGGEIKVTQAYAKASSHLWLRFSWLSLLAAHTIRYVNQSRLNPTSIMLLFCIYGCYIPLTHSLHHCHDPHDHAALAIDKNYAF